LATPKLSRKVAKEILKLHAEGTYQDEIAKKLNISQGVVSKVANGYMPPDDSVPSPPVKSNKKAGETDWREWVPAMKQMQVLKKKGSYSQDHAVIELGDGTRPIAIAGFSDQHLGAWSTDYDSLIQFTDEFLSIPDLYLGLIGDYEHMAIKLRNVLEVSDNLLPPEQQGDFFESWFGEIWHKVAWASWENHSIEREERQSGRSLAKRILNRKVVYFNGIGHVDIKVGDQIYKGAVSHKFRGRSIENPCHAQMRYMRREGTDREFCMQGDTHLPGMIKYTDGDKTRVAINTGSIQTGSGYAKRYFSLTTHPVYPVIVFRHDRHEMVPFWSVKEWLASQGK
jgi:hypothetical protein